MAFSKFKHLHYSYYGAVVRDSTHFYLVHGRMKARSVEESTAVHLVDPKTKEELLLIGTCNLSTKLAYRTKRLVEDYKPDSVLIQAGLEFPQYSRGTYQNNEEFHQHLIDTGYLELWNKSLKEGVSMQSMIFSYKHTLMKWWLNFIMRTPADAWKVFLPGLEMKFILDAAQRNKSQLMMVGEDFDLFTYRSLLLEKKFDVIIPMWKYLFTMNESWYHEARDVQMLLRMHSLKDLTETFFNRDHIAWAIRFAEKLLPNQAKAVIDLKDIDMFWKLERYMEGKRKLAIVNQWHFDGFERLWRNQHGIGFRRAPTSGTEDMNDKVNDQYIMGIDADRKRIEEMTGYPMASTSRQMIPYTEETNSHFGL